MEIVIQVVVMTHWNRIEMMVGQMSGMGMNLG